MPIWRSLDSYGRVDRLLPLLPLSTLGPPGPTRYHRTAVPPLRWTQCATVTRGGAQMADNGVDQLVSSPTYMADIRGFFRPEDIDHMALKGIDLATYEGVKAERIVDLHHTAPPTPDMP